MDAKKTGLFIAQLRCAQGWTQSQLAQRLDVTDKAVSRWETGRGFPDVGMLMPLSEALGVSVIELLNGEHAGTQTSAAQADAAVVDTLLRTRRMIRKMIGLLLLLFGAGTVVFRVLYVTGEMTPAATVLGIGMMLAGAAFMLVKQETLWARSRMKLCLQRCACGAVWLAFILELLPWGVRMAFAAGPGKRVFQNASYFSLLPFGYGNVFPFLTACLTFAIAFLLLLLRLRGKAMPRVRNAAFFCTLAAAILSVPAAFFGGYVSFCGIGILVLLAASGVMQYFGYDRDL